MSGTSGGLFSAVLAPVIVVKGSCEQYLNIIFIKFQSSRYIFSAVESLRLECFRMLLDGHMCFFVEHYNCFSKQSIKNFSSAAQAAGID